jgi:hypothetical protein
MRSICVLALCRHETPVHVDPIAAATAAAVGQQAGDVKSEPNEAAVEVVPDPDAMNSG